jgi:hypothetical protein
MSDGLTSDSMPKKTTIQLDDIKRTIVAISLIIMILPADRLRDVRKLRQRGVAVSGS